MINKIQAKVAGRYLVLILHFGIAKFGFLYYNPSIDIQIRFQINIMCTVFVYVNFIMLTDLFKAIIERWTGSCSNLKECTNDK